jgi:hypothetical protein
MSDDKPPANGQQKLTARQSNRALVSFSAMQVLYFVSDRQTAQRRFVQNGGPMFEQGQPFAL